MTNSVTNRQMFFILIMTLTTYTTIDLPNLVAKVVGRSGWMVILAVALVFGGGAVVITKLNNRFPGMVMFDYSSMIVGKFVSRALAVYYIIYFTLVGVYLKVKLVEFLSANFLPKTPQFILLAFSVALFGYVAFKGITNVARLFELFGVTFLFTTSIICAVMLFQGMTYNIRPFFHPGELHLFPKGALQMLFPFGGIEVLLIIPFTKQNKKAPRAAFLTMLFIGFFYVLVVEGTISILGINNTILYNDSFIEAIKVVYVPIIERTDIFYLTVGLTSLFAGMIIVFLSVLEFSCRLVPRVKRTVVTPVIAAVLYTLCLPALSIRNITVKLDAYAPYFVAVSAILIPCFLMVIALVRKKRGAPETEDAA